MADEVTVKYPSFKVYCALVEWLDGLHKAGKVLDPDVPLADPRMVTRWDVGSLNMHLRALLEEANPRADVRG